ncbi:MAG: lysine--tRNA ligase [Candidatus Heimdallarchaeota archaeon]|nr:lysine--tRNA ligase [Candidatus Heimdallarchaeota archaeon]
MDQPSSWTTVHANEAISIFGDDHVVCSGWSPSGTYHIGNSKEAITCNGFHQELLNQGKNSKFVLVIDDYDPLDKIPSNLKEHKQKLQKYLGHPLIRIPDPFGMAESYAHHFTNGAKTALTDWGFDIEYISATDLYKQGKYDPFLKLYLEKETEIQQLMEQISGSPLGPIVSINCQNCGNQKTTQLKGVSNEKLHYICVSEKQYRGCGFEGSTDINQHEWKIKWRLDWPARQSFLKVTIEPSGKDHSVAGGSVDTALAVHERIFQHQPPLLLRFGFITIGGKKFAGSEGAPPATIISKIMQPSAFLYLIYRTDLLKDFDFLPQSSEYGNLLDEFDIARRMVLGEKFEGREREEQKMRTAAILAMGEAERKTRPALIKFSELATVYQTSLSNIDKTIEKLDKMGKFPNDSSKVDIRQRLPRLDYWLHNLAPENIKFKILDKLVDDIANYWTPEILDIWKKSINSITSKTSAEDFNTILRSNAEDQGIVAKDFYPPFYQLLIGESRGPNASNLVMALGAEEISKKLEMI